MIHFRKFEVVEGRGGLVLYHRILEKTIFNQACMPNPLIASHHVHEDVIMGFGEEAWAWLKGTGRYFFFVNGSIFFCTLCKLRAFLSKILRKLRLH